jgi:putative ABC transport system permease protein
MAMLSRWTLRLRALFRREDVEADFDEEVQYHFDREVERSIAQGLTPEQARRSVRRAFGNATAVKEEARETWRWRRVDELTQNLGYSMRIMRRSPGFTAVVIATLALGIGANTAVFSVVRSVMLRPLPFPDDDRLAVLLIRAPNFGLEDYPSSPPEYVAYRDHSRSWQELAAYHVLPVTVTEDGGTPERVQAARATPNLFSALRVEPVVGRAFMDDDAQAGSAAMVILSHAFWTSRFARDPSVIGKTLRLDGGPRTIVGVMPADFAFPDRDVRVWLPLAFTATELQSRGSHGLSVVGRLRDGVTLAAAEQELGSLVSRFISDASFNFHDWHPAYLRSLRTEIVGDVSRTLWVMLGAVALVLVIACANVANLMLVRSEQRAREMSVRTALGAGRRRLIWQLLTESVVMAGAGGIAGVAVAYLGVNVLGRIAPADLPRLDEISVDGTVLVFTLLLTVVAGVLFGLAPALHAGRADIHGVMHEGGRGATASRKRIRLRQLLVVSQTALAVVLLVAAGLLLQSFRRLMDVDPGFRAEGVLTATINIPTMKYGEAKDVVQFYESLVPRIASLPGVAAAGAATLAPLGGVVTPTDIEVQGWVNAPDAPRSVAIIQAVTPGYFPAMGIPLREGRTFDARDGMDAPLVAVVSEALANRYWGVRSAIGEQVRWDADDARFAQVVGVVPDVRQDKLKEPDTHGTLYLAHAQTPHTWVAFRTMTLTVRTAVEPTSLVGALRSEVEALDPTVPLYAVRTMEQAIADATATQRFSTLLQLLFAVVALSLAAIGLYGVLAFAVARRTSEIGIRMALGAKPSDMRRMVVREGMVLVAIALVIGAVGALATGRLLESLLFGVTPGDPVVYASVLVTLAAVGLVACWVPARRASGVDPAEALRAG